MSCLDFNKTLCTASLVVLAAGCVLAGVATLLGGIDSVVLPAFLQAVIG